MGYTAIFERLLSDSKIKVMLNTDFFEIQDAVPSSTVIIYSGPIDRFFNYKFGALEWRSLTFEHEVKAVEDFQGTAVMNYAEESILHTRIHEPRHLHPEREYTKEKTLIIKEYPRCSKADDPYYPINDDANRLLYKQYERDAAMLEGVFIGGRLGDYSYYDMHHTIGKALDLYRTKIRQDQ